MNELKVSMEIPLSLKKMYLLRREKDLKDCFAALIEKNSEIFFRIGHQLKGNALMFGYPKLAIIGAQMESSAISKNWQELTQETEELKKLLLTL